MNKRPRFLRSWQAVLSLLAMFACATFSSWASAAVVSSIQVVQTSENGATRVIIDTNGPTQHALRVLHNPERIALDLRNSQRLGGNTVTIPGAGVVSRVRTGVQDGLDLRVVIDLKQSAHSSLRSLPPDPRYGHRLVLELSSNQAAAPISHPVSQPVLTHRVPSPVVAAVPEGATVSAPVSRPVSPQSGGPEPGRQVGEKLVPRLSIVAIDAGHGGVDHGARGARGTREKDVTLSISRRLAKRINNEPGMKAVLVRDGDHFIPLRDRMVRARRQQADLFVSIHADAHTNRRAQGASVYVLSHRGASSEHAKWLAEKENAADLIGGVRIRDKDDGLAAFMLDLSQDAAMEASFDVAGRVLRHLGGIGNLHKRSVQQAGFMVLKSPDIPSILVETAFISNRNEEARLRDSDYQQTLASAIFSGVKGYFASYRPSGGNTLAAAP